LIIITNKNTRFVFINKSIINHLGKNPKNGGNPPKDKSGIKIIIFIKCAKLKEAKI
jgi:hypothetical protein